MLHIQLIADLHSERQFGSTVVILFVNSGCVPRARSSFSDEVPLARKWDDSELLGG